MGWGVAHLREHKLKLRNALARCARLDVCRDGVETLGHQLQSLLLKLGRAAVLSWGCGLHAKAILTATAVPPLLLTRLGLGGRRVARSLMARYEAGDEAGAAPHCR